MLILAAIVLLVGYAIPSFVPKAVTETWPAVFDQRVNLGLDLSGGSQILLEAEPGDVAEQRLEAMVENVRLTMRRAEPRIEIGDISSRDGSVSFAVRNLAQLDSAVELLRAQTQGAGMTGQRAWDVNVQDSNRIVLTPTGAGIVVARRIDPEGTKEVTVIRQGGNRILVQVPGIEDPEALKQLIGKTARLEFKLVDLTATEEQIAQGRAPIGSEILPMIEGGRIAVQRSVILSGDQLTNAVQNFNENGEPAVALTFDGQGGRRFARVTQENVEKPFAIILDDVVLSAPTIKQPILGGQASSAGSFTTETANDLAVQLRSGKLPVELTVIEERTVSAELGADSIEYGVIACILAAAGVVLFLFLVYGSFATFANIALILNVLMILGVMAIMNATLTLPGLAGFVLTVGAAVDANVLINERIKEELRRGRRLLDAVDHGFKEASTAIFDANITNTIAGALLYYFGSGPVRGFAVVLIIGIITSYFTAVVVVRLLVALWLKRARPKSLSL